MPCRHRQPGLALPPVDRASKPRHPRAGELLSPSTWTEPPICYRPSIRKSTPRYRAPLVPWSSSSPALGSSCEWWPIDSAHLGVAQRRQVNEDVGIGSLGKLPTPLSRVAPRPRGPDPDVLPRVCHWHYEGHQCSNCGLQTQRLSKHPPNDSTHSTPPKHSTVCQFEGLGCAATVVRGGTRRHSDSLRRRFHLTSRKPQLPAPWGSAEADGRPSRVSLPAHLSPAPPPPPPAQRSPRSSTPSKASVCSMVAAPRLVSHPAEQQADTRSGSWRSRPACCVCGAGAAADGVERDGGEARRRRCRRPARRKRRRQRSSPWSARQRHARGHGREREG